MFAAILTLPYCYTNPKVTFSVKSQRKKKEKVK